MKLKNATHRLAADAIIASLLAIQRFHQAVEVWNEVAPGPAYRADLKILTGVLRKI